jgi:hypothetical protein
VRGPDSRPCGVLANDRPSSPRVVRLWLPDRLQNVGSILPRPTIHPYAVFWGPRFTSLSMSLAFATAPFTSALWLVAFSPLYMIAGIIANSAVRFICLSPQNTAFYSNHKGARALASGPRWRDCCLEGVTSKCSISLRTSEWTLHRMESAVGGHNRPR